MHNLQSLKFKIILLTAIAVTSFKVDVVSAKNGQKLAAADSLFALQKYTQSYRLYDSIYSAGFVSPSMLMKMAFIQEGLGDYTMALYYLNDYYTITSNESVLEKMESLAEKHSLVGYDYSDSDYFISVYHEYYDQLLIALIAVSCIFLGGILYQKFRHRKKSVGNFVFFTISVLTLLAIINFGMGYHDGIITHPNTYIMSQPSSSSDVIEVVGKGHKIALQKDSDVWFKTEWNGQEAYIKKKNILPVYSR